MNSNSKPIEDFNEFDFSLSDSEDDKSVELPFELQQSPTSPYTGHPYKSLENPILETDVETEKRLLRDIGAYDYRDWSMARNYLLRKTGKELALLSDADVDNEIKRAIHRRNTKMQWQRDHRRSRSKKAGLAGVPGAKAYKQPLRREEKLAFFSKKRPSSAGGKRQKKTRRKSRFVR